MRYCITVFPHYCVMALRLYRLTATSFPAVLIGECEAVETLLLGDDALLFQTDKHRFQKETLGGDVAVLCLVGGEAVDALGQKAEGTDGFLGGDACEFVFTAWSATALPYSIL